ncbi:MAG: arylsulfatase [Deltaproteobacteria bacterium]|nr:MAG: arylsulfatase [Deltaproteobacteria bacterium]
MTNSSDARRARTIAARRNRGVRICAAALACAFAAHAADAQPPNVVLMLSDNLGYGEIGAYGGGALRGAPTPRLDRLAAEGMRFTNFNVEVECTPSRSALLTGRMPVRSGTWRAASPGLPGGLAPWEVTLAETLSAAGYDTAIFGKWHLGDSPGRYPTDQGFDRWWGFPFSTNVASYTTQVGFDPKVAKVPQLLEGVRGEPVREVEPYTLENRPLIDERIAEMSIAYIREHAESERPFFLFVSWSLVHHPYLPHPEFDGRSGNGAFADVMVEHDHRAGQILDALDEAGIANETLVIYASDNGPDSAHYPAVSNSGPFRGYLGSAYEGSIRTPLLVRWPGKVPAGRATNEIVALVDVYPTLAKIAGTSVPDDRVIDGVDQSALLFGETERSARESVLVFSGRTLLAAKWRRFKVFFTGDDPSPRDRAWHRLWAPLVYNVEQDPREEVEITIDNLWILQPVVRKVYEFLFSVQQEGLILPGGDEPQEATVEIPFQSPDEIERSLSAIKWRVMREKVKELLPFGPE